MKEVWPARLFGEIAAPASKSDLLRALLIASLAEGTSRIIGKNHCDDVLALLRFLQQVGVPVTETEDGYLVHSGKWAPTAHVECGECGFLSRVLPFVCAAQFDETQICGRGSLPNRSQQSLFAVLDSAGIAYSCSTGNMPFSVSKSELKRRIRVENGNSSQPVSGLLIGLPIYNQQVTIDCLQHDSRGYVSMTLKCMRHFGVNVLSADNQAWTYQNGQRYSSCEYTCEGDWSSAALLLASSARSGDISLRRLDTHSNQPDRAILDALRLAGVNFCVEHGAVTVRGTQKGALQAFEFDVNQCPDLAPALAVLAAQCHGTSTIHGMGRLTNKESDRATGIERMLNAFGIATRREPDILSIEGGRIKGSATVDSQHDHRLAMAAALLSMHGEQPSRINDTECIGKSYPTFWDDLHKLGYRG